MQNAPNLILSAKGNVLIQAGKELVVKGGPKVQINPPGEVAQAHVTPPSSGAANESVRRLGR